MTAPNVLIIGGTRFIGLHVGQRLVDLGCDVTLFHRGKTEPDGLPSVRHLHGDRSEILEHRADFERVDPEVVLDMMPLTRAQAVDTMMTFSGIAGRLVGISSQDVYLAYDILRGKERLPPVPTPMDEDAPLRSKRYPYRDMAAEDSPLFDYDKIPVEHTYLADPDLPGSILRLPAVYGPGDYQHRPFPYLKRMIDGRPAILIDEATAGWRWSRCFVENVADAIALVVTDDRARGRIYNVAEPRARTEPEWILAIADQVGWTGEIITLEADQLPAHLRDDFDFSQSLEVDTSRIRTELGYTEPVPFVEAMRRTVEWELANMPDELLPHRFDYAAEDEALPDLTLGI
ncbi:MAG: NAD-dependent dehydratase [Gammaproteobacteria bacterium]|nr:NAD-dependent dehydratase [Gammaproteobacteria bacterium]